MSQATPKFPELAKSGIFAAIAVAILALAVATRPRQQSNPLAGDGFAPGAKLFTFDPTVAASMKIVKYDEALSDLEKFEVAKNSLQRWVIPSHENYPADAETQIRDAATLLTDTQILAIASTKSEDHETFGVVQPPDEEKAPAGSQGIGTLVAMRDGEGNKLAELIVGKRAASKDGEIGADQRFVRVAGKDPVYVTKIDMSKLSTKFEDWIEKDLLQLNALDLEYVTIEDYTIERERAGGNRIALRLDRKHEFTVSLKDNKWNLDNMQSFPNGRAQLIELTDQEELNSEKLNELKTAVDDLKIVDVRRKPEGFSADLRAANDTITDETFQDLLQRGFVPFRVDDSHHEIRAQEGEIRVGLKDGIKYILRFGNATGLEKESAKLNRYLFVVAQFDESKIPYPELEDVPKVDSPSTDKQGAKDEAQGEDGDQEEKDAGPDQKGNDDERIAKIREEAERVNRDNQRKLDDFNRRKKNAQEKIQELNARFANWYYVISDDTYKKIRLSRGDLIREAEKSKKEGYGVDAFRELVKEGLKK